jgi:hypothetical protein
MRSDAGNIPKMLQSDNAFDDVEPQDPLIVIRGNVIILRVHGGEVIDGNYMWILQVPDDSSPHYYLQVDNNCALNVTKQLSWDAYQAHPCATALFRVKTFK